MTQKPRNLAEALARAETLARAGKPAEAAAIYRAVLAKNPGHVAARKGLARLSRKRPIDPGALMARAQQLAEAGRSREAIAQLEQVRKLLPKRPEPANAHGIVLARSGRLAAAVDSFEAAIALSPDFAEGYNNLASALCGLWRLDPALTAAQKAVELRPDVPAFRTTLAQVQGNLGQTEAALDTLETTVALAPNFAPAHETICRILDRRHDLAGLRKAVERAEAACGTASPVIALRRAQLLSREGRDEEVLETLEKLLPEALPSNLRTTRHMLLGRSADRLGQPDAAIRHFTHGNDSVQAVSRRGLENPYLQRLSRRIEDTENATDQHWGADESGDSPAAPPPVFLVGFPRSGTTLLDSALRGHSRISVIEEKNTLRPVRALLDHPETFADFRALPDDKLQAARDLYRETLFAETDAPAPVMIDKMPLYLGEAALIHRLFPNARFILSLRHPCDCVLSGFMQEFVSNAAMDNFLTLEGSALLYDRVMTLWTHYSRLLDLPVVKVRYEDLIDDMAGTLAPVLTFLGCEWEDGVLDYRTTALGRDRIRTPSYRQVTQELYTDARNRWRRYETALSPHMALLEPWIAHWGYAD